MNKPENEVEAARKEAFMLTRGICEHDIDHSRKEKKPWQLNQEAMAFQRQNILHVLEEIGVPYETSRLNFHTEGYENDEGTLYRAISEHMPSSEDRLVTLSHKNGTVIRTFKLQGINPGEMKKTLEGFSIEELDEQSQRIRAAELKYGSMFEIEGLNPAHPGNQDKMERYRTGIQLAMDEDERTLEEIGVEVLKQKGYDVQWTGQGFKWNSLPENHLEDTTLLARISVAPEIFGDMTSTQEPDEIAQWSNVTGNPPESISNLILADNVPNFVNSWESDERIGARRSFLWSYYGNGEHLADPVKARDVLRVLAQYAKKV